MQEGVADPAARAVDGEVASAPAEPLSGQVAAPSVEAAPGSTDAPAVPSPELSEPVQPAPDAIITGPVHVEPPAGPPPEAVATARQVRRMTRAFVVVVALLSGLIIGQRLLEPTNLAAGKPWRTSSKWIDCDPNIGRCGPHVTRILFHTGEDESPWFELDLGAPTAFSSVSVQNRSDHLPERAVPLVLEVSDDQASWKELARRDELFSTWRPSFPTTTARFVRLRVPRRSFLHLESVRVHP